MPLSMLIDNSDLEVSEAMASGKLGYADELLRLQLSKSLGVERRRFILVRLIEVNVLRSKHALAIEHAKELQQLLGIRLPKPLVTTALSYLLGGIRLESWKDGPCKRLLFRGLSRILRRQRACASWHELRALQFAYFWNNIRTCQALALLHISVSTTGDELTKSLAWLGYSMGYAGRSGVAIRLLGRLSRRAEQACEEGLLAEILPLLGIVYEMAGLSRRALAVYDSFASLKNAPEFYRLLVLTNKIALGITNGDLILAENSVNECFSRSFALHASRHHVQIYGAKGILSGIRGRVSEGEEFLKNSKTAAKEADNPLDYLIYYRYSAIFHSLTGDQGRSRKALASARLFCTQYGKPSWYVVEIARIQCTLDSASVLRSGLARLRLLLKSLSVKNLGLILRPIRQKVHVSHYFWKDSQLDFLRHLQGEKQMGTPNDFVAQISKNLVRVLAEAVHVKPTEQRQLAELAIEQVRGIFHSDKVVSAISMRQLLQLAGELIEIDGIPFIDNTHESVRVPCTRSSYFIGVKCPQYAFVTETLFIGVVIENLPIGTEPYAEAALRVVLSQIAFARSLQESHRQSVRLEKSAALAQLSVQVAHDIRSPLAALNAVVFGLSQLPEEERLLTRSAISRIKDIANNLLEANRGPLSMDTTKLDSEKSELTDYLISGLIESLITEKRHQFRTRLGVEIEAVLDESSYGLFARLNAPDFKRVISNLINNSVESLTGEGRVSIRLQGADGNIQISVEDDGKGVPPEILPKLMVRGASFGKVGGNGLGLFHARSMAELWGGKLEILSSMGIGTRVSISLPRVEAPTWFVSEIVMPSSQSHIVILDDDPSIHQVWKRRFAQIRGIECHGPQNLLHFSTAEEFVSWKIARSANAACTDLYLFDHEIIGSELSGLDLIERFGIGACSILVTSRFEEDDLRRRCEAQKARLIPKGLAPFVPINSTTFRETSDAIVLAEEV